MGSPRLRRTHRFVPVAVLVLLLVASPTGTRGQEREEPPASPGKLAINLSVPRGPVGPEGPVRVVVRLLNVGGSPLALNARLLFNAAGEPGEVTLKVLGPDMRERKFLSWVVADKRSTEWVVLGPDEMIGASWDLRRSHDLDREGFYAVQAVYENEQDAPPEIGRPAWKGSLVSGVQRFRRAAGEEGR